MSVSFEGSQKSVQVLEISQIYFAFVVNKFITDLSIHFKYFARAY